MENQNEQKKMDSAAEMALLEEIGQWAPPDLNSARKIRDVNKGHEFH